MKKLLMSAILLLSSATASVLHAEEPESQMEWRITNHSKDLDCHLSAPVLMRHGVDFVESRKLVCWHRMDLVVAQSVSCGPEGSMTRFGKRLKVTCSTKWYAQK